MRFLVGYADTPAGRDALALAVRLAHHHPVALDIVVVLNAESRATLVPVDHGYENHLRALAERWLADALGTVPDGIEAVPHLVYADAHSEGILQTARRLRSSMIVVGAARGGLLGRLSVGSVASALLHSARIPVALAPEGTRAQNTAAPISRLTAAVGTRAGSEQLLDAALVLARAGQTPLRLMSLVALDFPSDEQRPGPGERARSHAREVLDRAAAHLPDDLVVDAVIATGDRIEDAVRAADWDENELVLVGSSRLARSGQLFLGSTAARMLRELPVPMIVVPRDSVLTIDDSAPGKRNNT